MTVKKPLEVPADLVELGRIVAAHGVRGQVKVLLHDTHSDTLSSSKTWWLQAAAIPASNAQNTAHLVKVLRCQRHHDTLVARLEGIEDRDQALALKGATLHLSRAQFPETDDDEYYWVDLIGCAVYGYDDASQDILLGHVTQVSDNGAHALLHVQHPTADADTKRHAEHIIPFVAAHIVRVRLAERRIDSNWPATF